MLPAGMRRCQRLPEVTHPGDPPRPETGGSIPMPASGGRNPKESAQSHASRVLGRWQRQLIQRALRLRGWSECPLQANVREDHMKKFIEGTGPIAALAAMLAAAVTAAAMLAVQPASAQSQPRIIVQSGVSSVGVGLRD